MSGVKNLRAMFENKEATSPPAAADDRGRSPGANSTGGTESPRPISRIRTNFIAIEKDGRIGLQRDNSRDSSVAGSIRNLSGDIEPPSLSRTTSYDKPSSSPEGKKGDVLAKTSLKEQPIPESPRFDSSAQMSNLLAGQSANNSKQEEAPPINPDNSMDVEEPSTKMVVGGPTDISAVTGNCSALPSGGSGEDKSKDKSKGKETAKEATPSSKGNGGKSAAPKPVSTAKATSKIASSSSTVSKPPKSRATAETPKVASKTPQKTTAHLPKAPGPSVATTTTMSAASSLASTATSEKTTTKRPQSLQPSRESTGFAKLKVKSPTRPPAKLPAGLTTHTAASATKFNVPRESLGASSSAKPTEARSHSRSSISTTATRAAVSGTVDRNLKRQSSTVSRLRPSIGPPPKQTSKDHPQTKKDAKVDEGFLARMMRPTKASASKTAEKPPTTPPRKTATAPAAKKAVARVEAKVVRPVKKAVAKTVDAVSSSSTSKPEEKTASAKEDTPLAEKVAAAKEDEPLAEKVAGPKEAVHAVEEKKNETEGPVLIVEDVKPEITTGETTAQEVAPVVEHAATAEEIVEAAKEIEGPVTLPEEAAPVSADLKPATIGAPAIKDTAPLVEQLESAEEVIEAAKAVEGDVAPLTETTSEAEDAEDSEEQEQDHEAVEEHKHGVVEEQEHEAVEEAPSEATLVNEHKTEEIGKPVEPTEATKAKIETKESATKPEVTV